MMSIDLLLRSPDEGQCLRQAAVTRFNLSARAYHRTQSVKLACTIADLAGSEEIQSVHLAEALHLRQAKTNVRLIRRGKKFN